MQGLRTGLDDNDALLEEALTAYEEFLAGDGDDEEVKDESTDRDEPDRPPVVRTTFFVAFRSSFRSS